MELWAGDVRGMATELAQLRAKVAELEEAIRWVVTQQADDLCWMDAYVRLGKFVGVEITLDQLAMLPKGKMMANCDHFITCLQKGIGYKPEGLAEENERLRAELVRIKHGEGRIDGSPGQSDGSSGKCTISGRIG